MADSVNNEFKIKAYRQKELLGMYEVSWYTWQAWIKKINDLGSYDGKAYTPAQVQKIVNHIGPP